MIIYCCHCGFPLPQDKENGTSTPIKCTNCKATGFITFMTIEPSDKHPSKDINNIITLQMHRKIN